MRQKGSRRKPSGPPFPERRPLPGAGFARVWGGVLRGEGRWVSGSQARPCPGFRPPAPLPAEPEGPREGGAEGRGPEALAAGVRGL